MPGLPAHLIGARLYGVDLLLCMLEHLGLSAELKTGAQCSCDSCDGPPGPLMNQMQCLTSMGMQATALQLPAECVVHAAQA